MYKDWRLRNSTELWRSNISKQSSGNGTVLPSRTREKHQGRNDEYHYQAGPKLYQNSFQGRGLLRNASAASSDAVEPSVRGKVSPYWTTGGRCKSSSSSWNSRMPSDDSDVTCGTSGESASLRAEEEFCEQIAGEGQETPRSVESEGPKTPRRHEFVGQTEATVLLPVTAKDIAVHPGVEDAQEGARRDVNDVALMVWGSTNDSSKTRHVQWQVPQTQLSCRNSSADLPYGESTGAECDVLNLDAAQPHDRETKWTPSKEEDCHEEMTENVDQKFGRPFNKFSIGGPLHALASLTQLDFSKMDSPRVTTGDPQQEYQRNSRIREMEVPLVESLDSSNAGAFLPEKPSNDRHFPAKESHGFSCISKSEEHSILIRANVTYEPVVNEPPVASSKPVTIRKKIKMKAPTPKLSSRAKKPTPNASGSKDVSVLQEDEQLRDENWQKKKFSSDECMRLHAADVQSLQGELREENAKKEQGTTNDCITLDAADVHSLQGELREENMQKEKCSGDDCMIVDAAEVESLRSDKKIANNEVPEDEKSLTMHSLQPKTRVVTHCEHSIDVPELQDPPSRRRWPKVSPAFALISNRNDTQRSSTSSTCESLQEERIPNGLHLTNPVQNCAWGAVQSEDVVKGEAVSPSSTDTIERRTHNGDVSVETAEDLNSHQFKDGSEQASEQQNSSSKAPVVFKTGLRISIPPASVREISINSASKVHKRTLPEAKQHQGQDGEFQMFSDELQSHLKIPSLQGPSPRSYDSSKAQSSEHREETGESPTLHESNSCTTDTNFPGYVSPEALDCLHALPQQESEDPSGESSSRTEIVRNQNSNTAASDSPGLSLATNSPEQPKRITQGSLKFGRGVWSSTPRHEEKYAERASLSSQKLCNILSYLGHVEESNLQENYNILQKTKPMCYSPTSTRSPRTVLEHDDSVSLADSTFTTTLTAMSNRSATESNGNSRDGDGHRKSSVSLFEGVRKKIQHYKDRITGQESQNAQLLRELERVTADKERALSLEREKFGKELELRANEYKTAIQHHLALNEKMIKDKEALSEKCCNLAGILSTTDSKFEEKLKVFHERAAQDLKKQKELWIAGEKPRREAWKETKLKEIKEITIKGLEPHIESIVEKHKQEMQKLETRCADEKQKRIELQAIQHRQEMCELRERLLKDRDDLLEKERMAALQRMNELAEKYEQQAMQLRMRVSGDMATELERLEESRRKDKYDAHELLSKFQKEATEREDTLRKGLENAMEDAVSKRDAEIVKLKKEWQKALDEKLQEEMQIKENELQARCTKERDEQIEMIIERMDTEKDEAVTRQQQDLLVKVERLMEEKLDFMKRMKEVESKCATLCQLSLEAKQKAETELDKREGEIESMERALGSQAAMIEQLKAQIQQEKSHQTQHAERFENRIAKEKELVQSALAEVERCNAEAQQMRARKVEELAEVEAHVRQAIDNKDLVIAGLTEQLMSAKEQIRHTEQLLAS